MRVRYSGPARGAHTLSKQLEDAGLHGLHAREGAAMSNFARTLETDDAEAVQRITRDPVVLDFVQLGRARRSATLNRRPWPTSSGSCSRSGRGSGGRAELAQAGMRRSDGVALAPVAVGAQQLEVIERRRAAVGDGQDVVILEVEIAAALDAPATVALKDSAA